MRYMIKSLSDKVTAVFIFFLLAEFVVSFFLAIDCMADYHFYAEDCDTYAFQQAYRVKTDEDIAKVESFVSLSLSGKDYSDFYQEYNPATSNVVVLVTAEDGAMLLTNLNEDSAFQTETDAAYSNLKPFSICDADGNVVHGTIALYLRAGLPAKDSYRLAANLIDTANIIKYPVLVVLVLLILMSIVVLGMIMSSVSRKNPNDPNERPERFIDKIPFDIMILIMVMITLFVFLLIVLTSAANIKQNNLVLWNAIILLLAFIVSSMMLLFVITLATRIKYGHVYRNTLIFRIIAGIRKKRGKENDGDFKIPFISKALITIGSLIVVEVLVTLFFLLLYKTHQTETLASFKFPYFAIFQLVIACIIGALFYMMVANLYQIRVRSRELADGNLEFSDGAAAVLFGDFREISNDFENIKQDIVLAMEEKNRSAEMRNELIANISHDIKTPLTSIINYADLVSSGGCTREELKNYLGVISHQSQKLNDLLQSLIDVSKVTSGEVKANYESLDIGLYLSQIMEEFSGSLAEKNLEVEMNLPDESVIVQCDSSMLWRVFQNLINNICKYAAPQSRVYIDITKADGRAVISLKNTSAQKISLSSEELLQRFKRNDKARSSYGNGLGLSISKSFTEIQNGTFDLSVDGDLFKTVLTFRLAENDEETES